MVRRVATIFSKIVLGQIPCHKILEDDRFLAFLDVRPIKRGHTLVILKNEIDYLFDLNDELISGLMVFAKKTARMIEKKIPCKRIGVMVAGLEVPHVHIHLVPINDVGDLNFSKAKSVSQEELGETAAMICG